jgi:hypothetical protein
MHEVRLSASPRGPTGRTRKTAVSGDRMVDVVDPGSVRAAFDSFECAIHALAPTCDNCGIHILGHGLEKEGTFFCCDHCAEAKGVTGLRDRIGAGGVIEMGSRA